MYYRQHYLAVVIAQQIGSSNLHRPAHVWLDLVHGSPLIAQLRRGGAEHTGRVHRDQNLQMTSIIFSPCALEITRDHGYDVPVCL